MSTEDKTVRVRPLRDATYSCQYGLTPTNHWRRRCMDPASQAVEYDDDCWALCVQHAYDLVQSLKPPEHVDSGWFNPADKCYSYCTCTCHEKYGGGAHQHRDRPCPGKLPPPDLTNHATLSQIEELACVEFVQAMMSSPYGWDGAVEALSMYDMATADALSDLILRVEVPPKDERWSK